MPCTFVYTICWFGSGLIFFLSQITDQVRTPLEFYTITFCLVTSWNFCYHAQSLCMWLMSSCTCWIAIKHVELQKHWQKNPNKTLTKKNSNQRVIHCQLNYVNDNFVCELHQINGNKFSRLKFIWIHVIPCKCKFFVTHSPYYFHNKHGLCFLLTFVHQFCIILNKYFELFLFFFSWINNFFSFISIRILFSISYRHTIGHIGND